jgi:diketogulonate reductase-like aldo/keto reductase
MFYVRVTSGRTPVPITPSRHRSAAFYFSPSRSANKLINSALAPYPDDLVITTKVWPGRDPSGQWYWAGPGQLRGQVEENLRQLGRDHLDVVNLRSRAAPKARRSASISPRSLRCVPPG